MNNAKVISVNPGVKTRGELNIGNINIEYISRSLSAPNNKSTQVKDILNLIFGINAKVNAFYSSKMMIARSVAGIMFLVLAALPFIYPHIALDSMVQIICATVGFSILFGVLTRIVSTVGTLCYATAFYTSMTSGSSDLMYVTLAMISGFFAVMGPGKYCVDQYLRFKLHSMLARKHRYDPERDASKLSFDYKAFGSIDHLR